MFVIKSVKGIRPGRLGYFAIAGEVAPPTFPSLGYIDQFNRAGEGPPPSASWTNKVWASDSGSLYVNVNDCAPFGAGAASSAYWTAPFGPDYEAYLTISNIGGGAGNIQLWTSVNQAASTTTIDGYVLYANIVGSQLLLNRFDNGSPTALATISQAIAAGDSFGLSKIGSTIRIYFKPAAGAWTLKDTITDSNYSTGSIGIRIENDNGQRVDNLGGGTIGAPPYSFPASAILDNFDRADNPTDLGANWTNTVVGGDGGFRILSNKARNLSGTSSTAWWSAGTFGPDCEVYVSISGLSGAFEGVLLRLATPGTGGVDGYHVLCAKATNVIRVYRIDNGGFTQLGADISQTIAPGDKIGASMVGSLLTVYYKSGAGAWTALATRTDAAYSAAGYLGLRAGNTSGIDLDDFGGGSI